MNAPNQIAAKRQVVSAMLAGQTWQDAVQRAGITMGRSTAYRLVHRVRTLGEDAYHSQRHGHPAKCRAAVRAWLMAAWRREPEMPASRMQADLEVEHSVRISIGHLNALRRQMGLSRGKKASTRHPGNR